MDTQVALARRAHEIFESEDILPSIFYFFNSGVQYDTFDEASVLNRITARKNLRSAALTSKAFYGPASNLLWRTLNSVFPLLKLLPGFVLSENGLYTINSAITPEHQQILKSYGSKVRHIYFTDTQVFIKANIVVRLLNLETPLFPNLCSLDIYTTFGNSTTEIVPDTVFLTLSSSLTSLSIHGAVPTTADDTTAVLLFLDQKKASLQALTLEGHLSSHTLRAIHPSFVQLKQLDLTFVGTALDMTIFQSWGSLTSLSRLSVNLNVVSSIFQDVQATEGTVAQLARFQTLKELRVSGFPVDIHKILRSVASSKELDTIALQICLQQDFVSTANAHIADIVIECVRISQSITNFSIVTSNTVPGELGRQVTVSEDSFILLSRFQRLESVKITGMTLAVKDSTFYEICGNNSWKNMRILHLPYASLNESPSIHSLTTIAKNCPNLMELRICVNLKLHTLESLRTEIKDPRMPHNLEKLYIVAHPESWKPRKSSFNLNTMRAIPLSRFIEHHFPFIKTLASHGSSDTKSADVDWWQGVFNLILEYRMFRKEMSQ